MREAIRCLVVDDEKLARTLLQTYIEKLPTLKLIAQCKDPFEALSVLHTQSVDLIFLDIQMPELTGIEFLHTLQEKHLVVFTTAYQEFAVESYQLDVVDYLVKPFRFERFVQAVNKATRRLLAESCLEWPAAVEPEREFLLVKSSHTMHKVFLDEIRYIQGMKEYVAFQLADRRILSLQSLKQLELELPETHFLRIHKSYIVAREKVTAMDGTAVYLGKEQLPIGASYREQVQVHLF